ncbi:hypothetical protein BGZ96_008430 [Linnemannia gamsii]|uniref:F-box domain-containing protein n=1 Tax=Linnemannia gamsii TaxID=64522 RepID=A0ABQ7KF07_9FUNG|nr:hypothetical protein BGZ96_008430 [Linnemannia gamsii]
MSDALERFFDMTELIDHLTLFLDTKDVSRLIRTSKTMYARCVPSLFKTLSVASLNRLLSSLSALQVLARNSQHVRRLAFTSSQLSYYYNCVLAFQDICSHVSDTPSTRPPWFPPLDVHTNQLVALPPMTRLSHFCVDVDDPFMIPIDGPPLVPISKDRTKLAHLYWMFSLSPHLASLSLEKVAIADIESCRRLGEAIAGLHALKKLDLTVFCRDNIKRTLLYQLFFSCSSSVRLLNFKMRDDIFGVEEDETEDTVAVVRRQEPLIHLEELGILGIYDWNSAVDIRSIFAYCPNVKKLSLEVSPGYQENDNIEQFIGRQCPRIELLNYSLPWSSTPDPLPFRIMESLPAQQVTEFVYYGALSKDISFRTDVAFHSHSTTLQKVCIDGKGTIPKAMASAIFSGCFNLETLHIARESSDPYIALADALEYPWACTKLQHLSLAISGCELPVEPGVEPYYLRPTPITLTEVETQHFSRLEDLYQRIGTLTGLRELYLAMAILGEDGELDEETMRYDRHSFPAMLNLQDAQTGRPGLLQLLSGLRNLEELRGSVSADSDETLVTVGRTEAIWMDQNWPDLQYADFFNYMYGVTEPFQWLEDKRKSEGRVVLQTSTHLDDGDVSGFRWEEY